jgi:hypothetical protein
MQCVGAHVPGGEGLVMGEEDGVVLGVRLVAALADPRMLVRQLLRETPAQGK